MKPTLLVLFGLFILLISIDCMRPGVREDEGVRADVAASEPGWQPVGDRVCYRAPEFERLSSAERRRQRGDVLYEVTRRWRGKVDDSFRLPEDLVGRLETVLLQQPEQIERLVAADFLLCSRWASGGLTQVGYAEALAALLEEIERNTCSHASYEMVTQYLEVDRRWQFELPLCQGDRIRLDPSAGYYTVEYQGNDEETVWITAEGDRSHPTAGTDYPCPSDGCFAGQLLARFVDRAGRATVFPVGLGTKFVATADGTLSFAINDIDLYDNRFRVVDGVKDFLLIEIRPASGESGR